MTERAPTPIFSVTIYYPFAFLAISITRFGLRASGVVVFVTRRRPQPVATATLLSPGARALAAALLSFGFPIRMRVGLNDSPDNLAFMPVVLADRRPHRSWPPDARGTRRDCNPDATAAETTHRDTEDSSGCSLCLDASVFCDQREALYPVDMRDLQDIVRGCTFDDFLFSPQYGVVERRDPSAIDLTSRFSQRLTLKRPLVSANMDTVTRSDMAIAVAEEGGIGVIDRGFRSGDIEPQVREVQIVKRKQHGVIRDPYTIAPDASLAEAAARMRRTGVGTLVVVDNQAKVQGLLTTRDLKFVDQTGAVASRMTPRDRLITHTGVPDAAEAEAVLRDHKVKKLPLLNADGTLRGLITARDVINQRQLPFATRDGHGRLCVGAAIGAKGDYLERAAELLKAEVDVIVIDIAHGHSIVMERAIEAFRKRFGGVELVAGNVATPEGVRFLAERHVNGVKVGIGPGGGCTTRLNTNFGVPQVQALVECREAGGGIPLIADGGVRRHGAFVQALLFGGDTVMLGSALAGTTETPGEIVQKPVVVAESNKTVRVPFKVFRGMASLEAIVDRLDVEDADAADLEALGAEGMEVSVPARGSVRPLLRDMLKHLCSAISYGGARSLGELQDMFRKDPQRYVIRLSEAGRRESFDR